MAKFNKEGVLVWMIPTSINIPQLLKDNPPKDFKPINDHFYFILDYICRQMLFQDLNENYEFVNLNAQIMQSYNRKYDKYLNYLTSRRILKCDNRFKVGEKSRGYCFSFGYLDSGIKEIPVEKITVRRKIKSYIKSTTSDQISTKEDVPYLTKWFNEDLKIDVDSALNEIHKVYPPYIPTGDIRGNIKKGTIDKRGRRFKAKMAIKMISEADFYYKVDNTAGRFHSNLTTLKKELKKHLRYDGSPLVSLDIANAQPLFSALLLKKEFWDGRLPISIRNIGNIERLFKNDNNYKKLIAFCINYITLAHSSKTYTQSEFEDYSSTVEKGKFYELTYERMFPGKEYDKSTVKDAMFKTFFSNNRFISQRRARPKKAFALAYPNVYEIFKKVKKDNHVILSHLLQRIESIILIENIALRISTERADLPIFTIHDSILTTKGNESYVKSVMEEEIYRLTGLSCLIRIED